MIDLIGEVTGLCPGKLTELEAFDMTESLCEMSPIPVAVVFYLCLSIHGPVRS